jgi:signal transduction histidine kinase
MMEERGLDFTAYLTWLIVAIPTLTWMIRGHTLATPRGMVWLACYVAFIVFFYLHDRFRLVAVTAQSLLAIACCFLEPSGFQPILLVIVAAQLAAQSLAIAIPWILAQTVAVAFSVYKSEGPLMVVVGYFAFELFGFFAVRIAFKESAARQELATANAELKVATELLDINSRTAERLRIARDLHDLLGHHLAALSINLEVARHLADGEAREQIEKSQAVTKLLLSDVRDVVSRFREDEPVDLNAAVAALGEVIQRPTLHLDLGADLQSVRDPAVAQIALRALQEIVTNSVRHSGARNLWLKVTTHDNTLAIDARDDGCGTDAVQFGNGLRGMRERVEQARGSIAVASMRGRGFEVNVRLPMTGAPA